MNAHTHADKCTDVDGRPHAHTRAHTSTRISNNVDLLKIKTSIYHLLLQSFMMYCNCRVSLSLNVLCGGHT